jgi:hypothetical protein
MKSVGIFATVVATLLSASPSHAAGKASPEMRENAEYMMRKIVEDIHERKIRTTVTDTTLDKSIQVVGAPLKFTAARKDKFSGEVYTCARVSLKTKIREGKKLRQQIRRTDEICTGKKTGDVRYMANIQ